MRKLPITSIAVVFFSVLFLSGALTRWYVFHRNTVESTEYLTGDAKARYIPLAQHLASRGEFSAEAGVPDTFDQPLYPLFLVPFLRHLRWAVAVQMLLELALIPAVWQVAKALGGSPLLAVSLLWALPIVPRWSSLLATEALATLFAALLLWTLVRGKWLCSGILGGLCILTRGDMVLAVALMFVAAFLARRPTRRSIAVAALALVTTLLPWSIRTYKVARTLNFVTGISGQTKQPYVQWMDMWADNQYCIEQYWWLRPESFPEQLLPDPAERGQALAALSAMGRPSLTPLSPEANDVFLRLTQQRHHEYPIRSLGPRIQRPLVAFATLLPNSRNMIPLSVGGLVILALSLSALLRPRGVMWIAAALLLGRALLSFISILGAETRYLVEAMPACFALCSVALCRIWRPRTPIAETPVDCLAEYPEVRSA